DAIGGLAQHAHEFLSRIDDAEMDEPGQHDVDDEDPGEDPDDGIDQGAEGLHMGSAAGGCRLAVEIASPGLPPQDRRQGWPIEIGLRRRLSQHTLKAQARAAFVRPPSCAAAYRPTPAPTSIRWRIDARFQAL